MSKKLAGWKSKILSKGGKVTLVKAMLASIQVYFLSLLVILRKVAQNIEKLQQNFLWSGWEKEAAHGGMG